MHTKARGKAAVTVYRCLCFPRLISSTALSPSPGRLSASLGVSIRCEKVQPCARARFSPFFPGTALRHSTLSRHTLLFFPAAASLFHLDELALWETAQRLHSGSFSGSTSHCHLILTPGSNLELTVCVFTISLSCSRTEGYLLMVKDSFMLLTSDI